MRLNFQKTVILLLLGMAGLVGCDAVRYGIWLGHSTEEIKVKAEFGNLKNHTVAILIYADESVQLEYPTVRLTLGAHISAQLKKHIKKIRVISPLATARYQDEHSHWESFDKQKICKDLNADFVLFVALEEYTSRVYGSMDAYQGRITATAELYDALAEDEDPVWPTDGETRTAEAIYPEHIMYSAGHELKIRNKAEIVFSENLVKFFYNHKVPKYKDELAPSEE
ncbi:MAG: hypothetical protein K8S55_07320 [Phycisphaerae bacterium]|nr:hypothetical protein [Phycisphaerae bacterium]